MFWILFTFGKNSELFKLINRLDCAPRKSWQTYHSPKPG